MKSMSLYVDRNSIIHSFDPITKLFYILAAVLVPFILPVNTVAFTCMVVSLLLLVVGKVIGKILPIFGFVFVILLSILVIQGMFMPGNHTLLFHVGPFNFYREGLSYAALLCMRVIDIMSAFLLLVLTTKPAELVQSLVEKGLSPRIGYVINSVLQIIPQMSATLDKIKDAQRSRGMETEGSLFNRTKAFFPLIGPVVMNAFIETKERAMALEVRGFNSTNQQTFLHERKVYPFRKVLQVLFVLIVIFAIVWRIVT
ncbi:MAG TPA: energy-coupling factor transporter transmembrane component T [Bacillales bacterium]|nr:energy-coupling factor transporter transmembrane component T [Bacillales bacterium]